MISIITPTFNRQDLVQTTINSILAQTYTDWELIVIDDGSTDNTEEVMQKYLEDSRIRYVKKANSGQASSLNVGVSYATGEFIVFLDSDDEAYPNWLDTVQKKLTDKIGIACSGAMRKFTDGTIIEEGMNEFRLFGEVLHLKFTCGSLFIRRSVFNAVNGYDASLKSNIQTDLGYRLLTHMKNTNLQSVVINEFLIQINIHDGPRIRTNWRKRREGGIQFLKKHYKFIRANDPKDISNICASIAFSSYKLKKRQESVLYLLKAIRHNPARFANYARIFKYALM